VVPAGKQLRPLPRLDTLDTVGLIAAMDHPGGWQRDMVHMMLIWRGDRSAIEPLEQLFESSNRPATRLEALCALESLNGLRDTVLVRALADTHPAVRRHAVRIAESRLATTPAIAKAVLQLATDKEVQVRLQVAFSLGQWHDAAAGQALGLLARRDAEDPYISAAVTSSATRHAARIVAELVGFDNDSKPHPPVNAATLDQLFGQMVAQQDVAGFTSSLRILKQERGDSNPAAWQMNLAAGFLDALGRNGKAIADLRASASGELKAHLDQLEEMARRARDSALDPMIPLSNRLAAVRLLGRSQANSSEDLDVLGQLLATRTPSELQIAAVAAASKVREPQTLEQLLKGWPSHGPRVRSEILNILIAHEPWCLQLLRQIEIGRVPAAEIDSVHRQKLLDNRSSSVRQHALQLFGRASDESRETLIDKYRSSGLDSGDRQRGSAVFQRSCAGCHRIGNIGHEIGPDLSSMANRSNEFFLAAVLDPNRAVETRYLNYVAATVDGRLFSGMLATETGNSVTLLAQEGKRETLMRADLEALRSTGKSLMPDGMERDIDAKAMADLLAFLHAAGPARKSFDGNNPELVKPELLRHELYLLATTCEIYGSTLSFEEKFNNLGSWTSEDDHAVWNFEIDRPAKYAVLLDYACQDRDAGNSFIIEVGDTQISDTVVGTGDRDSYRQVRVGSLTLEVGQYRLVFRPASAISGSLMDLRGIRITPAR
jgi:putative heme-binding domain-containing protein